MTISEIKAQHPDWRILVYSYNWLEEINCASCGKLMPYYDTYTSREQTTDNGYFGLPVCCRCYGHETQHLMTSWKGKKNG